MELLERQRPAVQAFTSAAAKAGLVSPNIVKAAFLRANLRQEYANMDAASFFTFFESGLFYENGWPDKQKVRFPGRSGIRNWFIVRLPKFMKYCGHPGAACSQETGGNANIIGTMLRYRRCWGIIKSPLKPVKAKEMNK
ncbi:hypothetical protein [Paenibacillus sp. S150]|uniref:hypothetical protein n=1 Tax=Paenibacillus sp. S150 TaxID=2749826 RepID=UPI001C5952C1|nr:hypothetical protein [Paenibacillus sp. S150]MBW4085091.1 hypothetical protein [Paenibacillus sp. S150]